MVALLQNILCNVALISGEGVGGFMKLPFKDTRFFSHQSQQPVCFYPANPLTIVSAQRIHSANISQSGQANS